MKPALDEESRNALDWKANMQASANPLKRANAARRTKPTSAERDASHKRDIADSVDVADYIADMARQLGAMAREANLDLLAYFLEMAQTEAEAVRRQGQS
jgi:hypothetical protein